LVTWAEVAEGCGTLEIFEDFRALPFGENEYLGMFEERFQRVWRKWGFEKENQVQSVAY
jgi:hypothetical protein